VGALAGVINSHADNLVVVAEVFRKPFQQTGHEAGQSFALGVIVNVEDTLIDMANYCLLLAALIRSKKCTQSR